MSSLYLLLFLVLLIILFPLFFALLFFYLTKLGFEILGFSVGAGILLLLLMLAASFINIPLGRKRAVRVREPYFFGFFHRNVWKAQGLSINLGGAVIPLLIVGYLLPSVPLEPVFVSTVAVTIVSFLGARFISGKGILLPILFPVVFAVFFALLLAPEQAASVAFISGVLGVLIGADFMNLPHVILKKGGVMSIGGGGVFDGIFLVGIISALLAGIQ